MRNGNRVKRIISILLTLAMIAAAAGCTTFDSFRHTYLEESSEDSMPVITIGVFEPLTGRNSQKGKSELKGIELANSIYSNVDGYKIVISKVDTQSKVSTAKTAVQGLIEMKPAAIIGSAGEAASLAASEYIQDAGIPAITPSATNPLITQTNDYYFRACITEYQMGEGLAEYAYERLGSRSIGIVSLRNDSSTATLIDGFGDNIASLAGRRSKAITATNEISATEEEMNAALETLRTANCDVCFVSLGTEAMDRFFTLAEGYGLSGITYLGVRSWGNDDFVQMMQKHPDIKVVFPYISVMTAEDSDEGNLTEEAERFLIEYQNRYGSDDVPTENAALGYDAYLLVINAIHNSKSTDGSGLRDALSDIDGLKGVTGAFSFDEVGNLIRTVNLSTIKDGTVVSEYVTEGEAETRELEDVESSQTVEEN